MKKGYYLKKHTRNDIILNIYKHDFIQYLETLQDQTGWIKFRIFERLEPASNGLTHEMEIIHYNKETTDKK